MAFTKDGYTLYKRSVVREGGKQQTIYFFAKAKPKKGTPANLPRGYEIKTARTGLPILRRSGGSHYREMRAEAKRRAAERKTLREVKRKNLMRKRLALAAARKAAAKKRRAKKATKKARSTSKQKGTYKRKGARKRAGPFTPRRPGDSDGSGGGPPGRRT